MGRIYDRTASIGSSLDFPFQATRNTRGMHLVLLRFRQTRRSRRSRPRQQEFHPVMLCVVVQCVWRASIAKSRGSRSPIGSTSRVHLWLRDFCSRVCTVSRSWRSCPSNAFGPIDRQDRRIDHELEASRSPTRVHCGGSTEQPRCHRVLLQRLIPCSRQAFGSCERSRKRRGIPID